MLFDLSENADVKVVWSEADVIIKGFIWFLSHIGLMDWFMEFYNPRILENISIGDIVPDVSIIDWNFFIKFFIKIEASKHTIDIRESFQEPIS